jgi:hypothetical protein
MLDNDIEQQCGLWERAIRILDVGPFGDGREPSFLDVYVAVA